MYRLRFTYTIPNYKYTCTFDVAVQAVTKAEAIVKGQAALLAKNPNAKVTKIGEYAATAWNDAWAAKY